VNEQDKILLVLDLDETLIYAAEQPLPRNPDFMVGPFSVYRRPSLDEFLRGCSEYYRLAIWSSASDAYVSAVVACILPTDLQPVLVWGRSRCVRRLDPETREDYFVKDLKKIKRRGFHPDRILAVDDTSQNGNAIMAIWSK
jgi:TFIIF-interacting CTD phosphatase-like protein